MQERSEAERRVIRPCLNVATWRRERSDNKHDKVRPHSIRSLQFDRKVRLLSFRPEKFDLYIATLPGHPYEGCPVYSGYARYEKLNLVSGNYSIRIYRTSSNSNLVNRTYCPKPFKCHVSFKRIFQNLPKFR